MTKIIFALALIIAASAALADRAVTPQERAAIGRTLAAEGCKAGGDIEFIADDNIFELDNVTCADGKLWEYDIDASYSVIDKELQDDGAEDGGEPEDDEDEDDGEPEDDEDDQEGEDD